MNHFAAMKSPVPVAASADAKIPLFCPKPRRPVAPHRYHQSGYSDAGVDLLDLILSKGEDSNFSSASQQPPLFCGSPPRRVSNPVVHDRLFGMDCPPMPVWAAVAPATPEPVMAWPTPRAAPVVVRPMPTMSPRSVAGCSHTRVQPAVRVEGFNCLDRGRGGSGHAIAAMA